MKNRKIGLIVSLENLLATGGAFPSDFALKLCEIKCWQPENYSSGNAERISAMVKEGLIEISGLWCGWSGPLKWNLYDGPHLLGLVPREYRATRIEEIKSGIRFAQSLGTDTVATHAGFIPENPLTTEYHEMVSVLRDLAEYAGERNIKLNLETGQETPVTLMRIIGDVALPNLGVNLDPANLLLYGRGNPVDAVSIYKERIRGVHIKDGFYPKTGEPLGREVNPGEGLVNFPRFLAALEISGYQGNFIIERELLSGNARAETMQTVSFLNSIFADL